MARPGTNLFCFIVFVFLSAHLIYGESDAEIEKRLKVEMAAYEEYIGFVSSLRSAFQEQIKKELNLSCSGYSGIMHGTIEELGMSFDADRRATIEEARGLELLVIEKFLQAINSNQKIKPFLEKKPFTSKQVQISIAFNGINGRYADESVAWIFNVTDLSPTSEKNHLIYYFQDPFTMDSIRLFEEPIEEAVKLNMNSKIKEPAVHMSTEKEEEFDKLLFIFRKEMENRHHLECWSIGGKLSDSIDEIGAKFVVLHPATQEQARTLLLDVAQSLLQTVNASKKLKPYFHEEIFPVNRLKLRISFVKKNYCSFSDGSMESVIIDGGQITYFQRSPKTKGDEQAFFPIEVPTYATESFQEAVKIVAQTL